MNKDINKLSTYILEKCKNVTNHEILNNELTITTRVSCIYKLLEDLKTLNNLNFNMLLDITAVDYPQRAKRFEIIYNLLSLKNHLRIRIKIFVNDNEIIP